MAAAETPLAAKVLDDVLSNDLNAEKRTELLEMLKALGVTTLQRLDMFLANADTTRSKLPEKSLSFGAWFALSSHVKGLVHATKATKVEAADVLAKTSRYSQHPGLQSMEQALEEYHKSFAGFKGAEDWKQLTTDFVHYAKSGLVDPQLVIQFAFGVFGDDAARFAWLRYCLDHQESSKRLELFNSLITIDTLSPEKRTEKYAAVKKCTVPLFPQTAGVGVSLDELRGRNELLLRQIGGGAPHGQQHPLYSPVLAKTSIDGGGPQEDLAQQIATWAQQVNAKFADTDQKIVFLKQGIDHLLEITNNLNDQSTRKLKEWSPGRQRGPGFVVKYQHEQQQSQQQDRPPRDRKRGGGPPQQQYLPQQYMGPGWSPMVQQPSHQAVQQYQQQQQPVATAQQQQWNAARRAGPTGGASGLVLTPTSSAMPGFGQQLQPSAPVLGLPANVPMQGFQPFGQLQSP